MWPLPLKVQSSLYDRTFYILYCRSSHSDTPNMTGVTFVLMPSPPWVSWLGISLVVEVDALVSSSTISDETVAASIVRTHRLCRWHIRTSKKLGLWVSHNMKRSDRKVGRLAHAHSSTWPVTSSLKSTFSFPTVLRCVYISYRPV
jgi:hypothetical protein